MKELPPGGEEEEEEEEEQEEEEAEKNKQSPSISESNIDCEESSASMFEDGAPSGLQIQSHELKGKVT